MKNHIKAILITVIALALGWTLLLTLFTGSVSEELKLLRREKLSDNIYLRYRIQELESSLSSYLLQKLPGSDTPVDGSPAEETTESAEASTEEITLPTHQSPETEPAVLYILAEHNGIIGVFDPEGVLLDTLNVFVMTLPEADREALAAGIPAYSAEEMADLVKQYE